VGLLGAVARDVDPVACGAPVADRLDGVRIRLGAEDVLLGVGLPDALDELIAIERGDAPVALLGVGKLHSEALLGDAIEQVPVVVERRIDVDGDARHGMYRTRL
jgi:hypothetical protein